MVIPFLIVNVLYNRGTLVSSRFCCFPGSGRMSIFGFMFDEIIMNYCGSNKNYILEFQQIYGISFEFKENMIFLTNLLF